MLTPTYDDIQEIRDQYNIAMRRVLQPRQLQVQLQLGGSGKAKEITVRQCEDPVDIDDHLPDKGTVSWMMEDEVLMCSNNLSDANMFFERLEILDRFACAKESIPMVLS